MGFGGINAHVVLESVTNRRRTTAQPSRAYAPFFRPGRRADPSGRSRRRRFAGQDRSALDRRLTALLVRAHRSGGASGGPLCGTGQPEPPSSLRSPRSCRRVWRRSGPGSTIKAKTKATSWIGRSATRRLPRACCIAAADRVRLPRPGISRDARWRGLRRRFQLGE